jgi:hypothetical protein
MLFSDLQDVECVLLLNFHHGSSELNSLVEVFEDLFFDAFHILFFVDSSTNTATSICVDGIF